MVKHILFFLTAFLAYFVTGQLGLLLAIPPGFASAVWPASGVALVCLLLLKRWSTLLGIGLGSFLLNLSVSSQWFENITWTACLPAIGISIGAMLQAFIGCYLFKRLIGESITIDSPQKLSKFIFVVSFLGSIIAPICGVNTLYYLNIISVENFWFSWLTWWVGDTIGVLLFTPLLLTLFSSNENVSTTRKLQISLPTSIIFTGILVLFFLSSEHNKASINTKIEEQGRLFLKSIQSELAISKNKLNSYKAFFNASNFVSQEEFNLFSKLIIYQRLVHYG